MVPAPNTGHQDVSAQLLMFVQEHGLGTVFHAPFDVALSNTDMVQPDLLLISNERADLFLDADSMKGPPDLVVEILSPSTADRNRAVKRALYARHGVSEYWMVDAVAHTVFVLLLSGTDFGEPHRYRKEDTLSSPTLKGFQFRLIDVF